MSERLRNCWAAPLGDCSPEPSKEHVISEGVLKGADSKVRSVSVLIPGEPEPLKIGGNSFVIRRLCRSHNGALSGADNEATALFRQIEEQIRRSSRAAKDEKLAAQSEATLAGAQLERWFAKTFLNVVYGIHALGDDFKSLFPCSSETIVKFLYGQEPLTSPQGLYVQRAEACPTRGYSYLSCRIKYLESTIFRHKTKTREGPYRIPAYMTLDCHGMRFLMLANVTALNWEGWQPILQLALEDLGGLKDWLYHPSGLEYRGVSTSEDGRVEHGSVKLRIGWPEKKGVDWSGF